MTKQQFAQQIKQKYPQYKDVDDIQLADRILEKYPIYKYTSSISDSSLPAKQSQSRFSDLGQDIAQTGQNLAGTFGRTNQKMQDITQAERGGQNVVRSFGQRVGAVAGGISSAIGDVFTGGVKALLSPKEEEQAKQVLTTAITPIIQSKQFQTGIQRYERLKQEDPALARDLEGIFNVGMLASDVLTSGAGSRGVNLATRGANRAIDAVETGVAATGRGARRVGFELEGALTGTSQETLEQAFQASMKGGKDLDQFTQALRGQVTPENLVDNVRESINKVQSANSAEYAQRLAPIISESVDTSNIVSKVQSKLNDFGVKVKKDGLDFSESRFRTVPAAQTKIQQAFDEVIQLGDNATLSQVDITRQALRELTLVGDDASARSANSLIQEAISSVRDAGKQIKGYETLLKNFGENAEFLDEITRSLASGDRATIDTAYRRLATSLKTNNERRMNLIKELDEATDGAILANISGQQLSELLPRGLFKYIGAGLAGAGLATGGVAVGIIPTLVLASPRVVGEFIRALGLGASKTKTIIDAIDAARKTLNKLDVPVPLASPSAEVLQQTQEE